jgi:hypothetical protein
MVGNAYAFPNFMAEYEMASRLVLERVADAAQRLNHVKSGNARQLHSALKICAFKVFYRRKSGIIPEIL